MKRINMTKYGFIRKESEDFSDDGNRFTGYTISPNSRLRVTKLVSYGRAYLSADMNGNKLDHTEYSSLPHYSKACWDYNGIDLDKLEEKDLAEWYNACVEYEKEYIEAESKITFPTLDAIREQCLVINSIRQSELNEVKDLLAKVSLNLVLKADKYTFGRIQDYYKSLSTRFFDADTYPQSIQKSSYGRNFIKPTNSDLQPSFYYKELIEILERYTV